MARQRRPKVAVWKFASCDGCQLTLLNCEEELLAVAGEGEIAYFLEASRAVVRGPYDLSLVEGSISTPPDAARPPHQAPPRERPPASPPRPPPRHPRRQRVPGVQTPGDGVCHGRRRDA